MIQIGSRGIHLIKGGDRWYIYMYAKAFDDNRLVRLSKGISISKTQVEKLQSLVATLDDFLKSNATAGPKELLGEDVYAYGSVYNGYRLIHVRKFNDDKPTKLGIALRQEEFDEIARHMTS